MIDSRRMAEADTGLEMQTALVRSAVMLRFVHPGCNRSRSTSRLPRTSMIPVMPHMIVDPVQAARTRARHVERWREEPQIQCCRSGRPCPPGSTDFDRARSATADSHSCRREPIRCAYSRIFDAQCFRIGGRDQFTRAPGLDELGVAAHRRGDDRRPDAIASRIVLEMPLRTRRQHEAIEPRRIAGTSARSPGSHASDVNPAAFSTVRASSSNGPSPTSTRRKRARCAGSRSIAHTNARTRFA